MSKILSTTIAIVVATVMIEPLIMGTITPEEELPLRGAVEARGLDDLGRDALDRGRKHDHRKARLKPDHDHDLGEDVESGSYVSHGMGCPPRPATIALSRPIWAVARGCHAYTKLQMTDAPMSEMASGRKMNVLASASRRTRSKSPAMTRPRNTLPAGRNDQPDDVVAQDLDEVRRRHDRVVVEGELAVGVEEAAENRGDGRVEQIDGEQNEGRADKYPRQDPVAPSGSQLTNEPADAEEQKPDAADADAQRDRGQEQLGK